MKKIKLLILTLFTTALSFAQVGVNTTTPQEDLHVVGSIQITDKIRLGGDSSNSGGNIGQVNQVLISGGVSGGASWKDLTSLKGVIVNVYNLIGTSTQNVNQGTTTDVNGLSQTITIPTGESRILVITATGFASQLSPTNQASQGAFGIIVNGTKISSGFVSSQNSNSGTSALVQLPAPTTFSKTVLLGAGTHIIKVNFKAWATNQRINIDAFTAGYAGADSGDTEAIKSRLTILEFTQ